MELLQQEKEVSGLYLSGHPLDAYREQSARIASHTIKDLIGEDAHVTDNSHVRIVCTMVKSMVTTKTNSMMAFTSVEDLTGTMEVIVFPAHWILSGMRCTKMRSWSSRAACLSGRMNLPAWSPRASSPIEGYNPVRPQDNRPRSDAGWRPRSCISVCPPAAARSMQRWSICWTFLTGICRCSCIWTDTKQ